MSRELSGREDSPRRLNKQAALLAVILLVLAFAAGSRYGQYLSHKDAAALTLTQEPQLIAVHVKGAVEQPGVYWFSPEQRVADGVEAAVAAPDADLSALNLAAYLRDGQELRVPAQDEAEPLPSGVNAQGQININTADSQQLQTLSGVGETKAGAIISYREQHGPFTSIDQLLNVSGIGQATLEQLRDHVCLD